MSALSLAKKLLCKNRFDSFAAAVEADPDDGSMICKWRADSFAAAAQGETPAERTCTEVEMDRHATQTGQGSDRRRHSMPQNRKREAAYLEALARQRGEYEPPPSPPQKRVQSRRQPSGASEQEIENSEAMDRIEAMELASREAAIREHLEQEMKNACSASISAPSALQPCTSATQPSPARVRGSRGSSQPGQLSGRRSTTPRSRGSLHLQLPAKSGQAPLVATAVAGAGVSTLGSPRLQRTPSWGGKSFQQAADAVKAAATETFLTAESFRQAALSPRPVRNDSFLSPRARRTSAFGRIESFNAPTSPGQRSSSFTMEPIRYIASERPASRERGLSPCSSRGSSFSVDIIVRNNSAAVVPGAPPSAVAFMASQAPGHSQGPFPTSRTNSFVPVMVMPNASSTQRAVAMVDEQAQLASRLSIAAEMIDNLVMDSSVLDEAKRLTEAMAQKQRTRTQYQQHGQRQMSPSPQPATIARPRQSPAPARNRSSNVFWKPPPEAAQLCARCPSLDVHPVGHSRGEASQAMRRTPSIDHARQSLGRSHGGLRPV